MVWRWFCGLGKQKVLCGKKRGEIKPVSKELSQSGADVCTRLCGHDGCRCGGTMRGLYCIWSYYRME
jgi:hypothetical protein